MVPNMKQNIVDTLRAITPEEVESYTESGHFRRGSEINPDDILILDTGPRHIMARVAGTRPYLAFLTLERGRLNAVCTCPVQHNFCKHAVALALHGAFCTGDHDFLMDVALTTKTASELRDVILKLRDRAPAAVPALTELLLPQWFDPAHEAIDGAALAAAAVAAAIPQHSPQLWTAALNTVRCELSTTNARTMLAVCEHALQALAAEGLLLGDATWHPLKRHALELHAEIARAADLDPADLAARLVDLFFLPGCPPPALEEYEGLLDETALLRMEREADERNATGKYPVQRAVVRLECALARGDWLDAKVYAASCPDQDRLFEFYHQSLLTETAGELLWRALDPDDEAELSHELLQQYVPLYLGEVGVRAYLRREFLVASSFLTYSRYLDAPGLEYEEAVSTLLESAVYSPDLALLAATRFRQYEAGLFLVEENWVRADLAADWAALVEMHHNPESALHRTFAFLRFVLTGTDEHPAPRTRDRVEYAITRILSLRTHIAEISAGALRSRAELAWQAHVDGFKAEFQRWPHMAEVSKAFKL